MISSKVTFFHPLQIAFIACSGDQAINAICSGCKNVTLVDINPYAKYYYFLKVAAIICLDYEDFFKFLRYVNYPRRYKYNYSAFNIRIFEKLSSTLISLDKDSYFFWYNLFQMFIPIDIREKLFTLDECEQIVITSINKYLNSKSSFLEAKNKVKKVIPNFIEGNLVKIELHDFYDNIWLSNVATYLDNYEIIKNLIYKLVDKLNHNGKLLISYLYQTDKYSCGEVSWESIYNIEQLKKILKDLELELISFKGTSEITKDTDIKDSILLTRKR